VGRREKRGKSPLINGKNDSGEIVIRRSSDRKILRLREW